MKTFTEGEILDIVKIITESADERSKEFTGRQLYRNTETVKARELKILAKKEKDKKAVSVLSRIKKAITTELQIMGLVQFYYPKRLGQLVDIYE